MPTRNAVLSRGERSQRKHKAHDMYSAAFAERATYENPHQFAVGIGAVLINGVPLLEHGTRTGATPGEMLKRSSP